MALQRKTDTAIQLLFRHCVKASCFPGTIPLGVDGTVSTHDVLEALGLLESSESSTRQEHTDRQDVKPSSDEEEIRPSSPENHQVDQEVEHAILCQRQDVLANNAFAATGKSRRTSRQSSPSTGPSVKPGDYAAQQHPNTATAQSINSQSSRTSSRASLEDDADYWAYTSRPVDYRGVGALSTLPATTAQAIPGMYPSFASFSGVPPPHCDAHSFFSMGIENDPITRVESAMYYGPSLALPHYSMNTISPSPDTWLDYRLFDDTTILI